MSLLFNDHHNLKSIVVLNSILAQMFNISLPTEFMDRDVDTSPIAPALAELFDNVLDQSM